MELTVVIARVLSVLAFGGPLLMGMSGQRGRAQDDSTGDPFPVYANIASFGVFFLLLAFTSGSTAGLLSVAFGVIGATLSVFGSLLTLRARKVLGDAWSFVPKAGQESGLVTTGPYRLVRHPIYSALTILVLGEAIAFKNVPALLAALFGVLPTFLMRAQAEETLLVATFGEPYIEYRERTKMLVPFVI